MMLNASDLTLKDLEYILAIARYNSFSQAAEACSVSQPALSKQLKSIEATLGVQLFERSKRQVMLTETGRLFVEQALRVMDEADKLVHIAKASTKPLSGPFRLGVIASSCPYLLPYFVGPLAEKYPDLKLIIKEGMTDHLVADLKQGMLDAVIAATTFEDEQLNESVLFFEPFLLAVSHKIINSALKIKAKKHQKVSLKDFDPQAILLLEDGHCLKDQTLEVCAIKETHQGLSFKATSLETLLHMTAGGLGLSVIPALAVPKHSQLNESLSFLPFEDKRNGRVMALYSRKSYPLQANLKALAQAIKNVLPIKKVQPL